MRKYLHPIFIFIVFVSFFIGCNTPKLENHYHLEWSDKYNKFQIWNIDGNRMKINEPVCVKSDTNCFYSRIYFSRGLIHVSPWVDFHYSAQYSIDEKGIIYMTNEMHDGTIDTLKLIPQKNCITSDEYFKQKLKQITEDFRLVENKMSDFAVSPLKVKNELIIGKRKDSIFFLFNDEVIKQQTKIKHVQEELLSVYVDERIVINQVLPILHKFKKLGYNVQFMSKLTRENNEQVAYLKKSIVNFDEFKDAAYKIVSCEYCEKYPDNKIDTVFTYKVYGRDSCLVNNKVTDFFQLRNEISRSLIKNRTTRLHSKIELEINKDILFKDYIELSYDLDFVNTELRGTYYRTNNDPDQKRVLELQNSRKFEEVGLEFPVRISEIFRSF
ncbi:hypothetical protein [Tenacibaculum sp. M341]|uniref:hypothetical protein n=1 Tax=Tenacibaculum sp. M341 TaxID=2530339 RepID=UPI00104D1D32|nr:hypothetical protein [Tenacibaculum sp. M341]TCI84731.1 hypothetical protein EYW44_20030 [Tenacibaculum sp. M341]